MFGSGTDNTPDFSPQSGWGASISEFCWKSECGEGDSQPYSFSVIAKDDGCPPRFTAEYFEIEVVGGSNSENFSGHDTLCIGEFTDLHYGFSDAEEDYEYSWSVQNGNITWSNPDSSNIEVSWSEPGKGVLTLERINKFGCKIGPDEHIVDLSDSVHLELNVEDSVCSEDHFTAEVVNPGNNYNYILNYSDSIEYSDRAEFIAGNSNRVFAEAENHLRCSNADTAEITVFALPDLTVNNDTVICLYDSAVLRARGDGRVRWSPAKFVDMPDSSRVRTFPENNQMYVAELTNKYECSVFDTVNVDVLKPAELNPELDTLVFDGALFNGYAGSDDPNLIIDWVIDGSEVCPGCAHLSKRLKESLEVALFVTDSLNCFPFDTAVGVEVIEDFEVHIPNAFSPDGNELNDVFKPVYYGIESIEAFHVYDRWGKEVFYTDQMNEGWNGYYNGKKARVNEVFVYKVIALQYNGETHTYTGKVVVIY